MDWYSVLRSAFALLFVMGLIMLAAHLLRKYGGGRIMLATRKEPGGKRLSVVDATMIDGRRKLVLIRRDDVEHLILLSADRETVIETGIPTGEHGFTAIKQKTWKVEE